MMIHEMVAVRLANQQLSKNQFNTPGELVSWMGAMQAQDYPMSKWAAGLRLPGSTQSEIDQAIDKGEILRTHLMRPTWHLVANEDICWLLELTAPSIKSSLNARHKELDISFNLLKHCFALLEKYLSERNHLTREELNQLFEADGIATGGNRSSHIMLMAELESLVCSGRNKGGKPSYALLSERVENPARLSREAAIQLLAKKYFQSHGPATLADFCWWSGLNQRDARSGIEALGNQLVLVTIENETFWMLEGQNTETADLSGVFLIPAFDEFVISYKERSYMMHPSVHKVAISENGIFRPVVISEGKAIGTWSRSLKKELLQWEVEYFVRVNNKIRKLTDEKARDFARFLGAKGIKS